MKVVSRDGIKGSLRQPPTETIISRIRPNVSGTGNASQAYPITCPSVDPK
jgi:hypothetical protein